MLVLKVCRILWKFWNWPAILSLCFILFLNSHLYVMFACDFQDDHVLCAANSGFILLTQLCRLLFRVSRLLILMCLVLFVGWRKLLRWFFVYIDLHALFSLRLWCLNEIFKWGRSHTTKALKRKKERFLSGFSNWLNHWPLKW